MRCVSERTGFTIVEVLVTIVFLAVVGVSLAAANGHAARILQRSRSELNATRFMESEVERLRLMPYASLANGTHTDGRGSASWTVVDSATFRQVIVRTRYGSAASGFVADSVTIFRIQ